MGSLSIQVSRRCWAKVSFESEGGAVRAKGVEVRDKFSARLGSIDVMLVRHWFVTLLPSVALLRQGKQGYIIRCIGVVGPVVFHHLPCLVEHRRGRVGIVQLDGDNSSEVEIQLDVGAGEGQTRGW